MSTTWLGGAPGATYDDPWWAELEALYETSFPGLSTGIARAAAAGVRWRDVTTPFVALRGGRPVAHVGVFFHTLVIDGQPHRFSAIHAVCTHPDHRRQGLVREAMGRALAWADAHTPSSKLSTGDPEVYTGHGFAAIPTVRTRSHVDGAPEVRWRSLDLATPADRALLVRIGSERVPLAATLHNRDPGWLLTVDAALQDRLGDLRYLPDDDAIAVGSLDGPTLTVEEVVATRPVSPARVAGAFDHTGPVIWAVPFDAARGTTEPTPAGQGVFMVRGGWPGERAPTIGPFWEH